MMQNNVQELTEEELDSFISLLTERTGIVPRSSHREGIKNSIQKILTEKRISVQNYRTALLSDHILFNDFVNDCTVNETYFFREEKQFSFLQSKVFPQWKLKHPNMDLKMWSAACSYGEEAYSLAVLALNCGIKPYVTASDINSEVLQHCRDGLFLGTSLRSVDGTSFQQLILPYRRSDGRLQFKDDIKNCINPQIINLSELDSPLTTIVLPKNQNIIFIRNVFIYFTRELRSRILNTLATKCLADDGLIFVSMSEIAQLDSSIIPPSLEKIVDGNIFYFHKKTGGTANG